MMPCRWNPVPNSTMTSITHHPAPQPRALLEALAAIAIIASLPPEQEAYERWLDEVDYRGPWPQIPWDELSDETQMNWFRRIRGGKETNIPPSKLRI